MKRLLFLLSITMSLTVLAQDGDNWVVSFNKQVIAKGTTDQLNVKAVLSANDFEKSKPAADITISYKSFEADSSFKRTFHITGQNDQSITSLSLNSPEGKVSFPVKVLSKMQQAKEPVFIYTTAIPKDPAKAALVRVRRVLLCKIEWN